MSLAQNKSYPSENNSYFCRCRFAITAGLVGDYESPKVRIQTGLIFKVTFVLLV